MIERIEARRIELNMSVKHLAERSTVPEATYRNILKGVSKNPSFHTIRNLALAVGLSLDELITAMDGAEPACVPDDLQIINQAPATTQELDSALRILMQIIEDNNASHAEALSALNEKFEHALIARDEQFARSLASKDAQFERDRRDMSNIIDMKDRWIRWEFILICMLITFICIVLLVDVLHPDVGWVRRALTELFSYNNAV